MNGGDGTEYARVALTGSLAAGAYLQVDIEAQNGAPDGVALDRHGVDTRSSTRSPTRARSRRRRSTGRRTTSSRAQRSRTTVVDSNTVDGSLSRIPDKQDTNNAASDWAFTPTKTPGAANVASP